jgi:hypothetical protein
MSAHPFNESFDVLGEWYLPENPSRKLSGQLIYTPERIELHLNEAFKPLRGNIYAGGNEQSYPVIHGTTIKGEAVTLLDVLQIGISLNLGSGGLQQPEHLISSWLIIGAYVPPDFDYPQISFRVPGLQIWLSRKIIEHTFSDDFSHSYRIAPQNVDTTPLPSIDATLEWGISWNSNVDAFTSISVNVSAWVTIKPSTPKNIQWYFEQQTKIAAMLAFLGGAPMSPDSIEASIDESHHKASVLVTMRDASYCDYTNPHEFYMTRNMMGVDLTEVVTHWFDIYPKVHMPSQLALSILASEKLWLHVEFLSLMQALEGLHRGLFDGNYMDENGYESVKKTLSDSIPTELASDHKDALRSRIRYGNQISLRKRLDFLSELLSDPIRRIILGGNGKVPRSWIDTRNYYTHWDEELRTNVLGSQEMYNTTVRMFHLLRALYLQLMKIPQEAILQSLSNMSKMSQHLAQINVIEHRRTNPRDTSGVIMTVMEGNAGNLNETEQPSP